MCITTNENTRIGAVCLGSFDGVHVGHQAIFNEAVNIARCTNTSAAVFTFHPHPGALTGKGMINTITTREQRSRLIREYGVNVLVEHPFTTEFAALSPMQFVENVLLKNFGQVAFVAGFNYSFGHKASGNIALLKELGRSHGFSVVEVAPVTLDGDVVSSTRVRRLISTGELKSVERCLGRRLTLQGRVMQGDRRGRTLGFPTANLHFSPEQILPPNGVYVVNSPAVGFGVANLGLRPTFPQAAATLEIHFLNLCGEIYGHDLEVEIVEYLRPERAFTSVELLKEQVFCDIEQARAIVLASSAGKC